MFLFVCFVFCCVWSTVLFLFSIWLCIGPDSWLITYWLRPCSVVLKTNTQAKKNDTAAKKHRHSSSTKKTTQHVLVRPACHDNARMLMSISGSQTNIQPFCPPCWFMAANKQWYLCCCWLCIVIMKR